MKKVGKTSRHDLNQIPYDYTVKVTNIQEIRSDRVPEELWTKVHDVVQEAVIKTIHKGGKKCKKAKWLPEEALQIAQKKKKRSERQRRKEKIYPSEGRFQTIARRDKKVFL